MASSMPTSGLQYVDNEGVIKGDRLILRGLMFYGFHGVKAEEKTLGQKFLVDIDAWMDLRTAGESDNFSDTVDYIQIYHTTKSIVEGHPHELVESVAELIASKTLAKYSQIYAIRVKVGEASCGGSRSVGLLGRRDF